MENLNFLEYLSKFFNIKEIEIETFLMKYNHYTAKFNWKKSVM